MKKPAAAAPDNSTQPSTPAGNRRPRTRRRAAKPAAVVEQAAPQPAAPSEAVAAPVAPIEAAVVAATDKKKKKTKVVRDSFTMPKSDYDKIAELKKKSLDAGINIKKSELLRAGLLALEAMPLARLKTVLAKVESIKTGRPSSKHE